MVDDEDDTGYAGPDESLALVDLLLLESTDFQLVRRRLVARIHTAVAVDLQALLNQFTLI